MLWFGRRNSGRKNTSAKSFNVHFPQSRIRDTFPNSNTGLQDCLPFLEFPKFGFALYLRCTCSSYISYNVYMLNGIFAIKCKNNHREILIMLCLRLLYKSFSYETQRNVYNVQLANEDFLWVSQLILSFQKTKNQNISCDLNHA